MSRRGNQRIEATEGHELVDRDETDAHVTVYEAGPGRRGICRYCKNTDPLTILLILILCGAMSYVAYEEFQSGKDIDHIAGDIQAQVATEFKMEKQIKRIIKERRLNSQQLSEILDTVASPKFHGMSADKAVRINEACGQPHCTIPCVKGRSEGFNDFLVRALETATPVLNYIPFLPKLVPTILKPVTALLKKITTHPYSTVSNQRCAGILNVDNRPGMVGAETGSSVKQSQGSQNSAIHAIGYGTNYLDPYPNGAVVDTYPISSYGRHKREVRSGPQFVEGSGSDSEYDNPCQSGDCVSAQSLAEQYGVEAFGDDEDEALDNVLGAIFRMY